MLVTGIEIAHYRYCPREARHLADVCLTLRDRVVTLFCALDLPPGKPDSDAFVDDAMRQMKRMPEVRSGRMTLRLAEGLAEPALV
ncbi:MAG: hypothetical protein KDK24_21315 [Pseudooceanicola sp.]|nr:hypothetical protein [Pseudooceanicola sp.]